MAAVVSVGRNVSTSNIDVMVTEEWLSSNHGLPGSWKGDRGVGSQWDVGVVG